jgi:pyruvate formate lyase activating enzyme
MQKVEMRKALFWEARDDGRVECRLCPHHCLIAQGKQGICLGRRNEGGVLYAANYGRTTSLALDPIEKKPLYHFHPGTGILSIAPNGCNFACPFCQNWQISQKESPTEEITPQELVDLARGRDSVGVAYTYTEPLIWYEFLLDACSVVREHRLSNVLVTNGMIEEEPLRQLLPLIDAMNIDLKSMDESFYKKVVKGNLESVLRTIRLAKESCHVELTHLVVPGATDSPEQINRLIDWIVELGDDTPVHFSRYFPHYNYDVPATPVETLVEIWNGARERLRFVYLGNIAIEGSSDTVCPRCGVTAVRRSYYSVDLSGLSNGRCGACGADLNIVQ